MWSNFLCALPSCLVRNPETTKKSFQNCSLTTAKGTCRIVVCCRFRARLVGGSKVCVWKPSDSLLCFSLWTGTVAEGSRTRPANLLQQQKQCLQANKESFCTSIFAYRRHPGKFWLAWQQGWHIWTCWGVYGLCQSHLVAKWSLENRELVCIWMQCEDKWCCWRIAP